MTFPSAESLLQDTRFALRVLRRSPVFAVVAILTLAFGIGANGAIFGVADALIARPLPGIDATRLAAITIGQKAPAAAADYIDWTRASTSLSDLAAYRQRNVNITGDGPPERLYAADVTSNFFVTLGLHAARGRTFAPTDDVQDEPVAVLTHGYWQRRFGGDLDVVGRTLDIDDRRVSIIGVMPADVELPVPTDIWLPLALSPADRSRRDILTLRVVGRLKPNTTIDQAQAELTAIGQQLEDRFPTTDRNRRIRVMPLTEFVQGSLTRRALLLLLGCVAVVLAIACVNIAGLQIARATSRERETNLRAALGASRWRIAQLALVENLIVAAFGGALGVFVASTCVQLLLGSMPADIVRLIPGFAGIGIDRHVLVFMTTVTLTAGLLSGLAPALLSSSKRRLVSSTSRQRLRSAFVVGQIAVALTMLVLGVMFVQGQRDLLRFHDVPDPARVVVLNVSLPSARYPDDGSRSRFLEAAVQRLGNAPGVRTAAACRTPPLSNNGTAWARIDVEGQTLSPSTPPPAAVDQRISPDFFQLLGVPLRAGRPFDASDREGTMPVAIVSEKMARLYWPNGDAIGKRVRLHSRRDADAPWLEIVGIAGNMLYDWTARSPEPVLYRPAAQAPSASSAFIVRVAGDAATSAKMLTDEFAKVDPLLPAYGVMSLQDAIAESLAGNAQITAMMNMLAGLSFLIAVIGIYGIVAYTVAARTREFGVRMALGARRADIFRLVMRHALVLSTLGVCLGAVAAFAATRMTNGFMFGTGSPATATTTLIGTAVLVALTTLLACCAPAGRATRIDPMNSLRVD